MNEQHANVGQQSRYDVCIAGLGGAGMLLLHAMHKHMSLRKLRILVIEPDSKMANDRTWCFWAKPNEPILSDFQQIVTGSWHEALAGESSLNMLPNRYFQIRSADLYALVKSNLQDFSHLHWHQASLLSVDAPDDEQLLLNTTTEQFSCKLLFDSRPALKANTGLKQSFYGHRIRTKKAIDKPTLMQLMHYSDSCGDDSRFWYVLPTDAHEALVELTSFSHAIIDKHSASKNVCEYAEKLFGEHTVVESEFGVLPMKSVERMAPKSPLHHAIGVSGGAIRGTTGYAFKKMHEHAHAICRALVARNQPPVVQLHSRHQFYDRLLLDILDRRPQEARSIFVGLFKKGKTSDILDFMEGKSSLATEMRVIWALHWPPFLKAVWRSLPKSALLVLILLLLSLALNFFNTSFLQKLTPVLLLAGMVFPGLPHGAVDQLLSSKFRNTLGFITTYVGIMALVILLWLISPMTGLCLFLAYSAWHFGQTDFAHWGLSSGVKSLGYGLGVLGILLLSHIEESLTIIKALGIGAQWEQPLPRLALSMLLFLIPLTKLKKTTYPSYWFGFIVLVAGSALPLLLAFGFYFIGIHSRRGWQHLEIGLKKTTPQLLQIALPYQLAAWIIFIALAVGSLWFAWSFEGWIPTFFVFLAALSSPHILLMHLFYQKKPLLAKAMNKL
ncbi:MAG: beta-carotene 15,15'-dioxygenase, Brp/Blh family [Bacteroidia bacterium]